MTTANPTQSPSEYANSCTSVGEKGEAGYGGGTLQRAVLVCKLSIRTESRRHPCFQLIAVSSCFQFCQYAPPLPRASDG